MSGSSPLPEEPAVEYYFLSLQKTRKLDPTLRAVQERGKAVFVSIYSKELLISITVILTSNSCMEAVHLSKFVHYSILYYNSSRGVTPDMFFNSE